jgi:hypothetical protein
MRGPVGLAIVLGAFLAVYVGLYALGYVPPPVGWTAYQMGPGWECGAARNGVCLKDRKIPSPPKQSSN